MGDSCQMTTRTTQKETGRLFPLTREYSSTICTMAESWGKISIRKVRAIGKNDGQMRGYHYCPIITPLLGSVSNRPFRTVLIKIVINNRMFFYGVQTFFLVLRAPQTKC